MKHMIKIFGSKGSRKRMICGVLALVLVCASLIGCASKQIGVDAVPQDALDTQTPADGTQKNDEPTTPVEPTEVTDVTEAPKDTEAAEPETEPTEAPTEEEVKPTEPKATEAPKPTEPKATEAPKPTEPKPTEAPKPAHTHSYRDSVVAPTCTEKGYTKHACSCGFDFKDGWKDALGHTWAKGDTVAPTISAEGYTNYTCSRCSATKQDDWTDKLEDKLDLEAAMAAGNAYALQIGFGGIDYSLTLDNAGYYPGDVLPTRVFDKAVNSWGYESRQALLLREVYAWVDATKAQLEGAFEATGETDASITHFHVRVYIYYNAGCDSYVLNVLYR